MKGSESRNENIGHQRGLQDNFQTLPLQELGTATMSPR